MADAIVPPGSSAILIGVSAYEYAELPPIRAARNSLQAMRSILADPALCGWPPGQIRVIANPLSAADLSAEIAEVTAATTGVLLLYYVGHGVLSAGGDLCLSVTATHPDRPETSGLPWPVLARALPASPAHTRLSILDCCFGGQATAAGQAPADDAAGRPEAGSLAAVNGGYTLAAAGRDECAAVPEPVRQDTASTLFTAELCDLVAAGLPGRAPWLTFGDLYPVLRERLVAKGLPAPAQYGTGPAREFAFTANAALCPGVRVARCPPAASASKRLRPAPVPPRQNHLPHQEPQPRQPLPPRSRLLPHQRPRIARRRTARRSTTW